MSRWQWMLERFAGAGDTPFMIWRNRDHSYKWLLEQLQNWRERLAAEIPPASVVAVEGDFTPQAVAAFLALTERRDIAVPLTAAVAAQNPEFLEIAEVQSVISFTSSAVGEITGRRADVTHPLLRQLIASGDPGLVLFSSGSTGKSKAALHNLSLLLEKFRERRRTFVTLTFLLFDHIGGVNTLLYSLANTGTLVTPESRDPDAVCQAIERHRVELLPTSPTFLNLLLLSEVYKRFDLSSLQRITYGTEPMPSRTLERLHALYPGVEMQQTYGLTELGILRSKSRHPGSLWVKIGGEGFETAIRDHTLWIRARSAMLGYLNAPTPFDADGWFNTGDLVETEGEYIRFRGRQADVINVGGAKVSPAEVEEVLLQMPNVRDVLVLGEPNPITGQVVVARFLLGEPEGVKELRHRMRAFCRQRLAPYQVPARVEILIGNLYGQRYKKMRTSHLP